MRDSFLHVRERAHFLDRAERYKQAMAKGGTTSDVLLRADFGTDNPRGLDIVADMPRHRVVIKDLRESKPYQQPGDMGDRATILETKRGLYTLGESNIYINPKYYGQGEHADDTILFSSTLAHEHIHLLQYEDSRTWNAAYNNSHLNFIHWLDDDDNSLNPVSAVRQLYHTFNRSRQDSKTSQYLIREQEIQARMHEILTCGYASWQRMPANKIELWACMDQMGVDLPHSIWRKLRRDENGIQAMKDFSCSGWMRHQLYRQVDGINKVHSYLSLPEHQERFWHRAMPAIYGNLLELYGDRLGRERMEAGMNPRPAKAVIQYLKDTHSGTLESEGGGT